jgi:tetratricopeptide (TPR) repeat protein
MMTERLESALKAIKECHSKRHWDDFLSKYGDVITGAPSPRLISEIFRKLESDPQSLNYDPNLWGHLLTGAIACWNIESGVEIAEFSKKLTVPVVSIPAAQVFLEAGKPGLSREFAQRALRLTALTDLERIQLDLLVASSFAEEGKTDHAVRVLGKVTSLVRSAQMTDRERADFVMRMGRLQYFMGRYPDAAGAFQEAAPILRELEDWEGAARALFNAGACIQNSGAEKTEEATALVEQARNLSVEHNLPGPRSHCEAFYGVEAYSKGNFIGAREHFRRAMTVLPASDKSFRRLHIMSFLSFTYFAMGKFTLGIKFGRQTIELAALDASERFKTRYQALEAEILWEEGKIPESMHVLKNAVHQLALHGVRNLEELSTLSRYQLQLAMSGEDLHERFKIDESLQKDQTQWLEYRYSRAALPGVSDSELDVVAELEDCLRMAKSLEALNHQACILLLIIRKHLQDRDLSKARARLSALEIAVSRLGDTPLRARLQVVYAAMAYQSGDFDRTFKLLHAVEKMAAVSWSDRFAVMSCLATIRGESPRFQFDWQEKIVASFVSGYFAPTIKLTDGKSLVISDSYEVNLEKHSAMAELMQYLIGRGPAGAALAEIQTDVWQESVKAQGWQQKIRNAVMRVRDLCPYTIAPILIHNDRLRFFSEAITVVRDELESQPMDNRIRTLLKKESLSSQQVAEKINVSLATAKRILKKMTTDNQILVQKDGRSVVYRAQ